MAPLYVTIVVCAFSEKDVELDQPADMRELIPIQNDLSMLDLRQMVCKTFGLNADLNHPKFHATSECLSMVTSEKLEEADNAATDFFDSVQGGTLTFCAHFQSKEQRNNNAEDRIATRKAADEASFHSPPATVSRKCQRSTNSKVKTTPEATGKDCDDDDDVSPQSSVTFGRPTPSPPPPPRKSKKARPSDSSNDKFAVTPSEGEDSFQSPTAGRSQLTVPLMKDAGVENANKNEGSSATRTGDQPVEGSADEAPDVKYIRIGWKAFENNDLDNNVPMNLIFVGEVNTITNNIVCRSALSWHIGGLEVGSLEENGTINMDKKPPSYHSDYSHWPYNGNNAEIDTFLLEAANGNIEFCANEDDANKSLQRTRRATHSQHRGCPPPIDAPLFPALATIDSAPTILSPPKYDDNDLIDAVITFKNLIPPCVPLQIESNLQAKLEYDERYDPFETYIMRGDGQGFEGLSKLLEGVLDDWEVQIWVLPHRSKKLYCWSVLKDMKISGFTDEEIVSDFGACVYIEVHTVEKTKQEKVEKSCKGKGKAKAR